MVCQGGKKGDGWSTSDTPYGGPWGGLCIAFLHDGAGGRGLRGGVLIASRRSEVVEVAGWCGLAARSQVAGERLPGVSPAVFTSLAYSLKLALD